MSNHIRIILTEINGGSVSPYLSIERHSHWSPNGSIETSRNVIYVFRLYKIERADWKTRSLTSCRYCFFIEREHAQSIVHGTWILQNVEVQFCIRMIRHDTSAEIEINARRHCVHARVWACFDTSFEYMCLNRVMRDVACSPLFMRVCMWCTHALCSSRYCSTLCARCAVRTHIFACNAVNSNQIT